MTYIPCDFSKASLAEFISASWILCPEAVARRFPWKYTATV